MAGHNEPQLDRELADLPADLRWREWMRRTEAVLFASATPVARDDPAPVVGQGTSVDLLIEDLAADLKDRPYEVAPRANLVSFRLGKYFLIGPNMTDKIVSGATTSNHRMRMSYTNMFAGF